MRPLTVYFDRLDEPARATALAAHLLGEARAGCRAILCSYAVPGDVLALGRYHVVPPQPSVDGVAIMRRTGGGRAAPLGAGHVGVILAMPDRATLAAAEHLTLEQILNRYVRGLLGALESFGVRANYPGRDLVTVDGRLLASLGVEIAADGATVVEMCVAVERSFACVTTFADRADPTGTVPVDLVLPDQATSIAEAAGRAPDLEQFAAALATGYATRLGCDVVMSDPLPPPAPDAAWLAAGRLSPHLDRHAAVRELLGAVEVYAARAGDRVRDVRLCGDLLARSTTVERIETALRDAPIERATLRALVEAALREPDDVLLGVRAPATVGDLVYEACRP
jgi:lipoate-protein ligase A